MSEDSFEIQISDNDQVVVVRKYEDDGQVVVYEAIKDEIQITLN